MFLAGGTLAGNILSLCEGEEMKGSIIIFSDSSIQSQLSSQPIGSYWKSLKKKKTGSVDATII